MLKMSHSNNIFTKNKLELILLRLNSEKSFYRKPFLNGLCSEKVSIVLLLFNSSLLYRN